MKRLFITTPCISLALVFLSLNGQGQGLRQTEQPNGQRQAEQATRQDAPQRTGFHARRFLAKWVPEKGHWQIESNTRTPKRSVIYFFNEEDQLVYTEKVEGKRLNLKKKKTLLRLKTVLDQSIATWQANHRLGEKEGLVAASGNSGVVAGD